MMMAEHSEERPFDASAAAAMRLESASSVPHGGGSSGTASGKKRKQNSQMSGRENDRHQGSPTGDTPAQQLQQYQRVVTDQERGNWEAFHEDEDVSSFTAHLPAPSLGPTTTTTTAASSRSSAAASFLQHVLPQSSTLPANLSSSAVAHLANSPAERRGSGFLLLAAEAYEAAERTQLRADAIRQVAMELAHAAATAASLPQIPRTTSHDSSGSGGGGRGGDGGSRVASGSTSASLHRQYEDAMLHHSPTVHLGFRPTYATATTGTSASTSTATTGATYTEGLASHYPEVDNHFREQIYMAAAKMQMHHQHSPPQASQQQPQQQHLSHLRLQPNVSEWNVEHHQAPSDEVPTTATRYSKRRRAVASSEGKGSSMEYALPPPPLPPLNLQYTSSTTKQPYYLNEEGSDEGGDAGTSWDDGNQKQASSSSPPSRGEGKKKSTSLPLSSLNNPTTALSKHIYHDYSSLPDSEHFVRKKTGGVMMPFPEKLMNMLDRESNSNPTVVSWLSHGRAFIVYKPKIFTNDIMAGYFRQSKLTSFQRQLNLYGFRRITQGADAGAYYHELFLRGRPKLCMRMTRQKVKGTGHKQPTDVASEPNLYALPALEMLEGEEEEDDEERKEQEGEYDEEGSNDNDNYGNDDMPPPLSLPDPSGGHTPPPLHPPPNRDYSSANAMSPEFPPSSSSSSTMYSSPNIRAATLLRRLSGVNPTINAPPLYGGGGGGETLSAYLDSSASTTVFATAASTEGAVVEGGSMHGFRLPPQSSSLSQLRSCARADAAAEAMASLGNLQSDYQHQHERMGRRGSSESSNTSSSLKDDAPKMEYV